MGTLYYSSATTPIHVDDTLLAHLKVVMATKLRRGESFTLAWQHDENSPAGRTTLWIDPSIPLRFVFDDADPCVLDPQLVKSMADEVARTGAITLPPLHTPTAERASAPERTRQVAGTAARRRRGAVKPDAASPIR